MTKYFFKCGSGNVTIFVEAPSLKIATMLLEENEYEIYEMEDHCENFIIDPDEATYQYAYQG